MSDVPKKVGRPAVPNHKKFRQITVWVRPDQHIWCKLYSEGDMSRAIREAIDRVIYGEDRESDL